MNNLSNFSASDRFDSSLARAIFLRSLLASFYPCFLLFVAEIFAGFLIAVALDSLILVKINFLLLPENQFQLELNSFVSNFELAQQTFLAGEISLALLRSPCFSLPLLPLFLLSITYSVEENPSISIFTPLSLFLPFLHFLSHPSPSHPSFLPFLS